MLPYCEILGDGPPIMLLHGFGTNGYSWRHVVPALVPAFTVLNVDLKGFGKSSKPDDGRYSLDDQSDAVIELAAAGELRSLVLIGHSMGGGVALLTALRLTQAGAPPRALVLIDSIAFRQRLPFFMTILRTPILGTVCVNLIPPRVQVATILRIAYFDTNKICLRSVENYSKPLDEQSGRRALVDVAQQIIPDRIDDLIASYPTLRCPTLILWGDHDRIVSLTLGRRLNHLLPNSELKVIADSGHMPHEETPEATLSQLLFFLRTLPQ